MTWRTVPRCQKGHTHLHQHLLAGLKKETFPCYIKQLLQSFKKISGGQLPSFRCWLKPCLIHHLFNHDSMGLIFIILKQFKCWSSRKFIPFIPSYRHGKQNGNHWHNWAKTDLRTSFCSNVKSISKLLCSYEHQLIDHNQQQKERERERERENVATFQERLH